MGANVELRSLRTLASLHVFHRVESHETLTELSVGVTITESMTRSAPGPRMARRSASWSLRSAARVFTASSADANALRLWRIHRRSQCDLTQQTIAKIELHQRFGTAR